MTNRLSPFVGLIAIAAIVAVAWIAENAMSWIQGWR